MVRLSPAYNRPKETVAVHEELVRLLPGLVTAIAPFTVRLWRPTSMVAADDSALRIFLIPPDLALIREMRHRHKGKTIIAVTRYSPEPEEVVRCLDIGADACLHVTAAELAARIESIDRRRRARTAPRPSAELANPTELRVDRRRL